MANSPAVDTSVEPGADTLLDQSRAQALSSLPPALAQRAATRPLPGPGPSSASASLSVPPQGAEPLQPADVPPEGAENPYDAYSKPPKGAETLTPEQQTHGNGDMWSLSNVHDFLRDEFAGTGDEVKQAIPRALLKLGKATTILAGGATAKALDKAADVLTLGGHHTQAEDAVFDYVQNYINPAIEGYTPKRAGVVGQDEGSGGAAQAIGGAVEMAPAMLAGGVPGAITLATTAGTNTATEGIDRGHSLRTAAAEGAVDAVATAVQALIPEATPAGSSLLKRVLVQVPAGDMTAIAGDVAKKKILEASGHQKEADEIDPLANLGEDTLQNIVFAAMGGHKEKTKAPVPGNKDVTPVPQGEPIPAPPVAKPAEAAPGAPPAPASAVPDTPSPEPASDLKAQWADMQDPKTPRTGVLVPKGSEGSTPGKSLEQAKTQGRAIELPQGTLVLKNKQEFLKTKQALDSGQDPQQVIGRVTGAGEGKTPDQTAVVQGQTPEGAVATESMVKPEDVPTKVAEVQAQGKQPVVTTPEAAVQRRQTEIQGEAAAKPPEGAEPVGGVPETEVSPAKPSDEEVAQQPTARRALVKTAAGERAVVLEGEPEGGKQKVRLIDDEGEPSDQVVSVPAESVRSGEEPAKEAPAPEPAKEPTSSSQPEPQKEEKSAKPSPVLDQLKEAATDFQQSQVPPKGRKFAGSVKERAQAVSDFARVLKGVASSMQGDDAAHAMEMAKKAERLDLKSDEAIAKNQGVGHSELSIHAENLLNAARKLYEPEFERPEPKSIVQEKLKAKVARAKEEGVNPNNLPDAERAKALGISVEELQARKAAGKKAMGELLSPQEKRVAKTREAAAEKPPEKVKVIADVPDETKPKELTKGEQMKLKNVGDRLIRAKDEDVDARASDVEKLLHEIYGDRMPKEDRDAFMHYLMGERRDRLRPKSRDEEIDEELGARGVDYRSAEPDDLELRASGAEGVHPMIAQLNAGLERSGMYPKLREATDRLQFKARDLLKHMASVAEEGPLRDYIQRLAAHQPESAVVRPVSVTRNGFGREMGETNQGLANVHTGDVQIKVGPGGNTRLTQALLHELFHTATGRVIREQPNHPAVREMNRLYNIFKARLGRQIGEDLVQQHVDYHQGTGPKPDTFITDLYGLRNPEEFQTEATANMKFAQHIARSERFRDERSEGTFWGGAHKLADAIVNTAQRLLGITNMREARLLRATLKNAEDLMEAQRKLDADRPQAAKDLSDIAALNGDPKPMKDEARFRGIIGRTATALTRQWYRSSQGRAVPALRHVVLFNETHDQIVRSNAHWFGKDDETNELRKYDAAMDQKNAIINRHLERARPAVLARQRLDRATDTALGTLQDASTRFGIDPSEPKPARLVDAKGNEIIDHDYDKRWNDLQQQWRELPKSAQDVYRMERDHNTWALKQLRRTAVDAALDTFSDKDVSAAQRSLLYNARTRGDFESLVGPGKLVDVGDRNDALKRSLQELAAVNQMQGPYFHLGRHGEYVVQVEPEVDQSFKSRAEAESYASRVREMSTDSTAKVAQVGNSWNVAGKAQYVSMHENRFDAEQEAARLRSLGHKVGPVTHKVESESGGALTKAMTDLIGQATQKLGKRGDGPEVKALTDALRSTLVQMVANRSAYAASKLSRAGFAGVKGSEMGRNFAAHAQSTAWNIGNLATTFKQGEALGKIREMAKRPDADTPQKVVYKRGAVMNILSKRLAQEVSQYGIKNPVNAVIAKLGYANFLASPSHTAIYMTQNFTTAYPTAGARWGYGKSFSAFKRATEAIVSPTMRATFKAIKPGQFGADDMVAHVLDAIKQHPTMGKWAPQLRELMDRGVITNTFAHALGHEAEGGNRTVQRVFDYARILPQMAEVYNRVSTALAGLELTGGDLQKTADFVRETHVDYSQGNKTYVGKMLAKLPGGNTLTMFHTYIQGMRHLLYSNIKNMAFAETKSRAEAAKTVAGLVVAMSLTAGVIKGAALEPLRGAVYAYNKIFGDSDEFYSLDNQIRRFVADVTGNKTIADAITGGLPHLLGFDLSSRMGLSDLFLHDPPDLLAADKKQWFQFLGEQLGGPMGQMVGEQKDAFTGAMNRGDAFGMLSSLVPIKQVRDHMKAMEDLETGHRAGSGAALTKPSAGDAFWQELGLKPADVARAQERQGDVAQYRDFIDQRRTAILGAWAKADPDQRQAIRQEIMHFNAANPGDRIKVQDLVKLQRRALRTQHTIETGQDKNPNIRRILDY